MSDSLLESSGRVLGDLVGRGQAALQQGSAYGVAGAAAGAVGGGTIGAAGVVTGPGELVIEPAAVGTGAAIGGGLGAAYGVGRGLVQGTPGFADAGAELGRRLDHLIMQMTSAQARAQTRVRDSLDKACATCGCSALANGVPGTRYRGGAHVFMRESGREPPVQSHHMPPRSISPLPADVAPAIQMDATDHYDTASFGRSSTSHRVLLQSAMIKSGNFMGAVALDAADIRAKFPGVNGQPGKYDGAVLQMMVYAQCLKDAGLVK